MVNPLFPLPAELGFVSEQEEASRTTATTGCGGAADNLGRTAVLSFSVVDFVWICLVHVSTWGGYVAGLFEKNPWRSLSHTMDGTGIFTYYIYHKNQPFNTCDV